MANGINDFGSVDRLEADSVGQPGNRTFRLLAWSESRTASLWLEKEELMALGEAIEQLLVQLGFQPDERKFPIELEEEVPSGSVRDAPLRPAVEFKVGRLGIGYDESAERFLLVAHDPESDLEGPPTFACRATQQQVKYLARRIAAVAAAGRPRCPLCGAPLGRPGEPHACPLSNGHFKTSDES